MKAVVALLLVVQLCWGAHTEDLEKPIDTTRQTVFFVVPATIATLSALVLVGLVGYHLAGEVQKSQERAKETFLGEYSTIN